METAIKLFLGWIAIQLVAIGFTGGTIFNQYAMGDCSNDVKYHWSAPIIGAVLPLVFFIPDINTAKIPSCQLITKK